MNDLVVLPLILILIAVARSEVGDVSTWASFLGKLLLLGPAIGFAVGGAGAWAMSQMDRLTGIRTEYQALYGIGLVLAAYSAASATVAAMDFSGRSLPALPSSFFNQNFCDCFLDYGETTSEMAMLFAFVLFGAVLSGILGEAALWSSILMAFLVVCIFRPAVLGAVLARANMSWEAHAFVSWFGPRGLNSPLTSVAGGAGRNCRVGDTAGHGRNSRAGVSNSARGYSHAGHSLVRKTRRQRDARRGAGEHSCRPVRPRRAAGAQGFCGGPWRAGVRSGTTSDIRCAFPVELRARPDPHSQRCKSASRSDIGVGARSVQ